MRRHLPLTLAVLAIYAAATLLLPLTLIGYISAPIWLVSLVFLSALTCVVLRYLWLVVYSTRDERHTDGWHGPEGERAPMTDYYCIGCGNVQLHGGYCDLCGGYSMEENEF